MKDLWEEEASRGQTGKTSWSKGMVTSTSGGASSIRPPDPSSASSVTSYWWVKNIIMSNDLHVDIFRVCLMGLCCSWRFSEAPAFFCSCFIVVTGKIMSLFWTHCSISSPFCSQLKIKQSLSRTRSRRRQPHFNRRKVISHFYPIYRHINIFSEQTFQCLGDKTLKIFSSKYFCSTRV